MDIPNLPDCTKPFTLKPLFYLRLWGGREMAAEWGKPLPEDGKPYGESWEVVDREEAQSIIASGPLAGHALHELWRDHRPCFFGADSLAWPNERFPLLCKILDARDHLSLQVHPPEALAAEMGGEPKTEMWYVAKADPGAKLFAGLKRGVDRTAFEEAIEQGTLEDCVHILHPRPGDFLFLPSGRFHAIGAGFLLFEIQQNSDTTYRLYDWNRLDDSGNPRELHIEQSLRCIDFGDIEPELETAPREGTLVDCPCFQVGTCRFEANEMRSLSREGDFRLYAVVEGMIVTSLGETCPAGTFFLMPACAGEQDRKVTTGEIGAILLEIGLGQRDK